LRTRSCIIADDKGQPQERDGKEQSANQRGETKAEGKTEVKIGKTAGKTEELLQNEQHRNVTKALSSPYDTVFLFHNGAESYYAATGFRGSLRVELSTSSVRSRVTNEDEKVRQL
jgi:hypothetical protein